jgi:hypothetical protein
VCLILLLFPLALAQAFLYATSYHFAKYRLQIAKKIALSYTLANLPITDYILPITKFVAKILSLLS